MNIIRFYAACCAGSLLVAASALSYILLNA